MFTNFEELHEDLADYFSTYQSDIKIAEGSRALDWAIYDYLSHMVSEPTQLRKLYFDAPVLPTSYEAPCPSVNSFETAMMDYLIAALKASFIESAAISRNPGQVKASDLTQAKCIKPSRQAVSHKE